MLDWPHQAATVSPDERAALEAHAAAYALDALEPDEAAAFERHLAACSLCRSLAQEFHTVVDQLPDAIEPPPASPALKRRLLAAARADTAAQRTVAGSAPAAVPRTEPPAPHEAEVPARASRVPDRGFGHWWQTLIGAPGPAVAAALLVVSLGLATWNVVLQQQLNRRDAEVTEYRTALAAVAGGRVVELARAPGAPSDGRVALILPPPGAGQEARLVVSRLPPPPAERTYQVWLIQDDAPRDAGTFNSIGGAAETVPVRGDPARAQAVAITVEPTSGSRAPTSQPFMLARL